MKRLLKGLIVRAIGFRSFLRLVHRLRSLQERIHPAEFTALRSLIPSGATVFDVGANIGYTACCLARGPGVQVLALEPDADNLACMRSELGAHSNITVVQCAVGADDGSVSMDVPIVSGVKQHALGRVSETPGAIELRSIDSLAKQYGAPGFLKIDVEGYEGRVLDGMLDTIASHRPIIYAEVCGDANLERYRDTMARFGYSAHVWSGRHFTAAEVVKSANYLFLPASALGVQLRK